MVVIKKGDVITAEGAKNGKSAKGDYFLCRVSGSGAGDKITIWNNEGFSCIDGAQIKVDEIVSVTKKRRQYQEKWYDETNIVCKLSFLADKPTYKEVDDSEELPI